MDPRCLFSFPSRVLQHDSISLRQTQAICGAGWAGFLWSIPNSRVGDLLAIISGSIGQRDNATVRGSVNCDGILNVSCYINRGRAWRGQEEEGLQKGVSEAPGIMRQSLQSVDFSLSVRLNS